MLSRINRIIATEKSKEPGTPGIILLFKRVSSVLYNRVDNYMRRKNSTFSSEEQMFMCSLYPKKVLDIILTEIKPKSVLDVGCGTGVSLSYFVSHGVDVVGLENSDIAKKKSQNPERILKYNLNRAVDLKRKFDLVWCFEVIEHIHPDYERNFLKTLSNHSSLIILSAAKPGQGGHGHYNEQPQEYWIERFENLGYTFDEGFSIRLRDTQEMHAENLMVFRR